MMKAMVELVQAGVGMALESPVVGVLADTVRDKVPEILMQHFSLSSQDIGKAFQKSFGYSLAAIALGMVSASKSQNLWQQLRRLAASRVSREFSMEIEQSYLQPFSQSKGLSEQALEEVREASIQSCLALAKQTELILPLAQFPEADLAALMNESLSPGISELLLARIQEVAAIPAVVAEVLAFDGLLGDALLFFVREQLRRDERVEKTLAALSRAGLATDIRALKGVQQQVQQAQQRILATLQSQLEQRQEKLQSGQQAIITATQNQDFASVGQLAPELSGLQQSVAHCQEKIAKLPMVMQGFGQRLARFEARFGTLAEMLTVRLEAVLEGIEKISIETSKARQAAEGAQQEALHTGLKVDQVAHQVQAQSRAIATLLRNMEYLHLKPRIQARDEFTQHTARSRQSIQLALQELEQLAPSSPGFSRVAITLGSALSSLGEEHLTRAERLFEQGQKLAKKPENRALAAFNLFQVRLRQKNYDTALAALEIAVEIDPQRFALHEVKQFRLTAILGSGSMGCAFLAHYRSPNQNAQPVVIKSLWDTHEGALEEIFKDVFTLDRMAEKYIPRPLAYGYGDPLGKKRPYIVMEYLPGALNGEQYIQKHGPLSLAEGLNVGLQIAHALQIAHQAGIYHLDIRPANIALQREDTLRVKIIDFGLARVTHSLRREALAQQSQASGKSRLGQEIISGLEYASPEQLGSNAQGAPGPHSDLFGFGASLYHLLSGESPRTLNPLCLPQAPAALYELLCQCMMPDPAQRPQSAEVLVTRLQALRTAKIKPRRPATRLGPLAWIAAISLSMALAGVGYWLVTHPTITAINNKKALRTGQVFQDHLQGGAFGPRLIVIPAGQFLMGDLAKTGGQDEQPVHAVIFSQPFAIGIYELSVGKFRQYVEASGYVTEAEQHQGCWIYAQDRLGSQKPVAHWQQPDFQQNDHHPVVCVSATDIQHYLAWLRQQTGQHYRLPSEAEWEYAARAGSQSEYWWGNHIGIQQAACNGCGDPENNPQTVPIGTFAANPWGLHDTVANVWEWTCSRYEAQYNGEELHCTEESTLRAIRGGSWLDDPHGVRVSLRSSSQPNMASNLVGFRVLRTIE